MKTFLFQTDTTMKPYNRDKWWIDRDIVPQVKIEAKNLEEAISVYIKHADKHGVRISKNALKCKQPMFRDRADGGADQVGWVITGSSDFQDDDTRKWSNQYLDLWVEVSGVVKVFKNALS